MRLIIVRHAEAEHNVAARMVAGGPSRLTDKGRAQVERVSQRLRDEHFDAAFSSDIERALHTAQGIIKFHPEVRLQVVSQLRERNMGDMEGKTRAEFIADAKASGAPWYAHKPNGGESMLDTQARAGRFIEQIRSEYAKKTVLLVTHGGFIRALLAYLLDHDYENQPPIRVLNTSISIVEVRDGSPNIVRSLNDIGHLDEATSPLETVR